MAKTGIRYAVFAPITNQINYQITPVQYDRITDADAYTVEKYKRWMVKAGANNYCQYSSLFRFSPVAAFNGSVSSGFVNDYGDDGVADSEAGTIAGTLSIELNDDISSIYRHLFESILDIGENATPWQGAIIDQTVRKNYLNPAAISYNVNSVVPYVGVGAVGKSGNKWVAKWYPLVKFQQPNDDNQTKQENVTFGHITLEGEIFVNKFGIWKQRKSFDDFEDAKEWLKTRLNPENWSVEDE